jgi:hypothetical protein
MLVSCLPHSSVLEMEAIYSSETSADLQRTIQSYIPGYKTHYSHRCDNLKFTISSVFLVDILKISPNKVLYAIIVFPILDIFLVYHGPLDLIKRCKWKGNIKKILKKCVFGMWTGFFWLNIELSDLLSWRDNEISGFIKGRGILHELSEYYSFQREANWI